MTANRFFTKAVRRLHQDLKNLENRYTYLILKNEPFDNIFVFFVDRTQDFEPRHEVKNGDYSIEIAVPLMQSYAQQHDSELLLRIADVLRSELEKSSMNINNKKEIVARFAEWDSEIRKQTLQVFKSDSID